MHTNHTNINTLQSRVENKKEFYFINYEELCVITSKRVIKIYDAINKSKYYSSICYCFSFDKTLTINIINGFSINNYLINNSNNTIRKIKKIKRRIIFFWRKNSFQTTSTEFYSSYILKSSTQYAMEDKLQHHSI